MIINKKVRNIIHINKRYLLDLNDKLTKNDDILTHNLNNFFLIAIYSV